MTLKFDGWPPLLGYTKVGVLFQSHQWIQTRVKILKYSIQVNIFIVCPVWPWNLTHDLANDGAPLLCYFKLCASFVVIHQFKLQLQARNAKFGWKSAIFVLCDLEIYWWHWKTIGYLFYATSSFVHHFIATCESKLELRSGNAQFVSKSAIFCPVWPWILTHDIEKQKGTSSMPHQFICVVIGWKESMDQVFWREKKSFLQFSSLFTKVSQIKSWCPE